jgi:hypothetical protein
MVHRAEREGVQSSDSFDVLVATPDAFRGLQKCSRRRT